MSLLTVEDLTSELSKTAVSDATSGVSFKGKGLKLDGPDDCKEVVKAIKACPHMTYLDLEGNTLGVEASKEIAEALKEKKELKRALWKDLFTGRLKTEIPKALAFLGDGLTFAGAKLSELDLSDNAFGPIGVQALASLLKSPACFQLQELRLNNNGLGITGGKLLAEALLNCHENSTAAGQPLALKVFIAGRNRLENEGATALSKVFETLGSLEEIAMPQNGIYHKGISKISAALTHNTNLKVLNLNDNTLTVKGADSIASALPSLKKLQILNLGDCLLKNEGARLIAEALSDHKDLEELQLESNEIRTNGGLALVQALKDKSKLRKLMLGSNEFGEAGRAALKKELASFRKEDTLECPSDDDNEASGSENEDENDVDDSEAESEGEEEDSEEIVPEVKPPQTITKVSNGNSQPLIINHSPVGQFLAKPSEESLSKLQSLGPNFIFLNFKESLDVVDVKGFVYLLMKVSDMTSAKEESIKKKSRELAIGLYKHLFSWAESNGKLSVVNNVLFVYLGLIKDEDSKLKLQWDSDRCIHVLQSAIVEKIVPSFTQHILTCCLDRKFKKKTVDEITIA